jgi:predicted molibdopterin-dependent oxidoreductase YjgC
MSAPAEATQVQVVKVTINGREVEAREGQTILEAARDAGVDIPTLCHDPRLEPYGACRLCLVEVEGARGPMASCGTKVREGMTVQTHTEKIVKLRKFILELLLTNHPLDCPVCEAAGDCRLQDYAYEYLVDMVPWGWRAPEASDPGQHPNVAHFGSRCILCGRCVRVCREIMSIGCWGYLNRGYESEVDTPYRRPLEEVGCVSCGQCVSTCPVGAIVGQRAPQGAREWQTAKTRTTCSYCSNGCELVVHSYNGRLVRVTSVVERGLNKGNLCVKGRFGQTYVDSPERLLKPLVRDAGGELREASWDEAVARVAAEAARLKAEGSGDAAAVVVGTHATNEAAYLAQKLARAVFGSNNIAASDQALKKAPGQGLIPTIGVSTATNSREDLAQADAILVVGSNLTESNPVFALTVINAIRKGKTVIVVDPRTTELARRATVHLAPKPGTDLAVLRGMMAHIIAQGLQNDAFIADRTEGYEGLAGSLQGVDVDSEAREAGVDPNALREAAEAFAKTGSAAIVFGSGVILAPMAVETVQALAGLAMMTGSIGRPGTGVYPLLSGANSQGLSDMGVCFFRLPGGVEFGAAGAAARFDAAWGSDLAAIEAGGPLPVMLDGVKSGKIRFLYVIGNDLALGVPDDLETLSELDKVPFLVVQDSFLTATAKMADVVLPAAVSTEDEGTFTNGERVIQRVRAAVPPKGDSRPDWKIVQMVANELGADWAYSAPADVMSEIADLVPSYAGVSYARLEEAGVAWPFANADEVGTPILYAAGFKGVFAPVSRGIARTDVDADVPFALITGSVLEHHETGERSRLSEGLTKLKAAAVAEMNPADAGRIGLLDGAMASVSNGAGATIQLAVKITGRVPEGVVFVPGFDSAAPVVRLLSRDSEATAAVQIRPV